MKAHLPVVFLAVLFLQAPAWSQEEGATLHPRVQLETTLGTITLQLNGEQAPISTMNFLQYASEGFYQGTVFHRVIPGKYIQAGGHTADMNAKSEGLHPYAKNEWSNGLKHVAGSVAFTRLRGNPNSISSQFFINVADNPYLDRVQADGAGYPVFGMVVDGTDVLKKIESVELENHPSVPSLDPVTPVEPVEITAVTVLDPFAETRATELARAEEQKIDQALAQAQEVRKAAREAKAREEREAAMKSYQEAIEKVEKQYGKTVEVTNSGLMYAVLNEGSGPMPKETDTVEVHYRGTLVNGEEFDSSYKRGKPAQFGLQQVIKGWTEGVSMMKVGGKRILIVPPKLGYGETGAHQLAGKVLIFEVELLGIK